MPIVPLLYLSVSTRPVVSSSSPVLNVVLFGCLAISIPVSSTALIVTSNVAVNPSKLTVTVFLPAVAELKPLVVKPVVISLFVPLLYVTFTTRPVPS